MELKELVERVQKWNKGDVKRQLEQLEQCANGEECPEESIQDIINSVRDAIELKKNHGLDMSTEESRLTELEKRMEKQLETKK